VRKLTLAFIVILSALPLSAEYLFITDGSIIKGRVMNETRAGVTFRSDEDRTTRTYPRNRVMRVHYTEMSFNRIYLQLHSGESMSVFLVGEDRTTYTFRRELYKPEEFIIPRAEVLSISERNPSGLRGEAGYSEIRIAWLPPRETMRRFRVYIKKEGEDEFTRAGTAGSRSSIHRISGLERNTIYSIYLTGVDDSGEETPSSNTIKIATLKPDDPAPEFTILFEYHFGRLTFTPAVILPLGTFGDMAAPGYGGFVSFTFTDLIFKNLSAGIEAGYFYMQGNNSFKTEHSSADSFQLIPFGIKAGYNFELTDKLTIKPAITAGAAYFDMRYRAFDKGMGDSADNALKGIDPMVKLSLSFDWYITPQVFIGFNGGYGILFEEAENLSFIYSGLNMGMRF